MKLTAREIASLLGGDVDGNADVEIFSVGKIESSVTGDLTFLSNAKYLPFLSDTGASVVIVSRKVERSGNMNATLVKVDNPYLGFCIILDRFFAPHQTRNGVHETAVIHATAQIGKNVYIGPYCIIEENCVISDGAQLYGHIFAGKDSRIGENTVLHPSVTLYSNCIIGDNCIIHAGTAIGSDGFGFAPKEDKTYAKIPQIGNVVVGNNVEIGANSCLDRATMGSTIIRDGVKMDNLVQIAHNAEIGEHTVIAGQTGIAGSTKVGKYCVIGAQVGVVGHIILAEGTQLGGQTGVPKTISEPYQQFIGSPALPVRDAFKSQVLLRNLPDLEKRVRELEVKLKELSKTT